ncbi:hypothetical protein FI667_g8581, partial [Globisporangium splendens]
MAAHSAESAAAIVCRRVPARVQALPHVVLLICKLLDASLGFASVLSASRHESVALLRRVAAHEHARWRAAGLSQARIACYQQQQFTLIMKRIVVENGALDVAMWLRDEYYPMGRITPRMLTITAQRGHVQVVEWLITTFPETQVSDPFPLLKCGHLCIAQWWWWRNHERTSTSAAFAIDIAASLGHLEILQFMLAHAPSSLVAQRKSIVVEKAAERGHEHIVRWLLLDENGEPKNDVNTSKAFIAAVRNGEFQVAKYLHAIRPEQAICTGFVMHRAALSGNLELLEWALDHLEDGCEVAFTSNSMELGSMASHWDLLKWLHERSYPFSTPTIFMLAVTSGEVKNVEWLYQNYRDIWDTSSKDSWAKIAARGGCLDMIQWLHEKGVPFTKEAMDTAAASGHLEIVKWLHEHRAEGCTKRAMDEAAALGHLEVVQFLHTNRHEGCTAFAMDGAAEDGRLDIVEFLHYNRNEGCTQTAMDQAAYIGSLDIVKFLHENRAEGCTTWTMDTCSDASILDFLHRNRNEGCTGVACLEAARSGNIEVLEWLYSNKRELVDLTIVREAAMENLQFHVSLWADAIREEEQILDTV